MGHAHYCWSCVRALTEDEADAHVRAGHHVQVVDAPTGTPTYRRSPPGSRGYG